MATVLVVDDHAVNREFLVNLLGYRQHRLIEASDGTIALKLAHETRPDLIISDILMPSGDGYELVRALRQDPVLAAVPVIFYTAHYNEREALSLARACGVNCVLTKPTAPDVILGVVDDMLAARGTAGLEPAVPLGFDRTHLRLVSKKLLQTTEELDWTTSRLMALIDMNLQLASEREPYQLARNFCRWTRDLVAARHAVVGLWADDDPAAAGHVAVSGLPEAPALAVEQALLETSPFPMPRAGPCAQHEGDPVPAAALGLPDGYPPVSTMLVVPVTSLARRFGWVCATGKIGRDSFNADDERLLSIFASQVGRIFENHRLLSAVTARTRELEVEVRRSADSQWRVHIQYAVAHVLAATSTIAEAAPELLKTICLHTGLDMAELWDIEPNGSRLRHLAVWHADPEVATAFIDHTRDHTFLPGVGMPGTVWETGQPIWIPDVAFGDSFRRAEKARAIGIKSAFAFPVIGRGRVVGILGFFGNQVIEADPEHIALFTALGSQVGQFIDRRTQEERILRLARIQAVMTGINALIVRVGDQASLFEGVCEIATHEGNFSHAAVITVGDDRPGSIVDGQDARLVDLAIASKRPAIDNDLKGNPGRKRAQVALPLTPGGEVTAVLVLHADATGFFTDDEMTLLTQLAADISFALETLANRARLRQVIYFDPLTGLPNRALFQERLGQALHVAREEGRQLAVITCSPRNIDSINATLGRHVGDEVLRQVAQRLQAASRFPDNLARTSGEGFSTFNPDMRSVSDLMLRLAQAFEDTFSVTLRVGEHDVHMNIQVGVAVFPADGTDGEALLANAEAALQGARSTTARISFFEPAMQEAMARRMALETRLAHAVTREEFVLHYQPKIDVATRALVGFEALIRWRDPMIGLVPPDRFIPLLEENGLIVDVGFWAFRQAARDHLIWRDAGLPAPPIAVNVSVVQLQQPDFVENVAQVLRGLSGGKDGPVPHGLDIEVTESAAMTSVEHTADKLRALRDLGIAISIDDFGTGHSSLGYLAQLPVSALKIDRSFVSTMTDKPASLMIVEAVISLAHSLDLHVIAEGVETEEQLALLRRFGCDQAQGYLISRPVDAEGAAGFMRGWRG